MNSASLLEVIAQSLLPMVGTGSDPLDVTRLVRDVWSTWNRLTEPAERQAQLHRLVSSSSEEQRENIQRVVRQLLPGRPDAMTAALSRYLLALPALLRRIGPHLIDQAEDLLRRLPPRVPLYAEGDRPAGLGDRELGQLYRISSQAEVWAARNPELEDHATSVVVFFTTRDEAVRVLNWHRRHRGVPGLIPIVDTALNVSPARLEFAAAVLPVIEDRLEFYRGIVELVAGLHQHRPAVSVGKLFPSDALYLENRLALMVIDPHLEDDPRQDMPYLGRLGQFLLPAREGDLAELLNACVANDPLERPPHAAALLEHLPPPLYPASGGPTVPSAVRTHEKNPTEAWQEFDASQQHGATPPPVITNSIGMRFVRIPAGKFAMGSPADEFGRRDNEGPRHEVEISQAFYLGIYPVTQAQYQKVMGTNPARFQGAAGGGQDHPVECVSWDDAMGMARWLSELLSERQAQRSYRLPTEAEWEYACRAGTTTAFAYGGSLSGQQASFDSLHPYGEAAPQAGIPRTVRVGSFTANGFGLYDMHGNVWEWCSDWYDALYYQRSAGQDPAGPSTGVYRVLRGGSWQNQAATCRSAYRNALAPNQRQPFIGFRLVLVWTAGAS